MKKLALHWQIIIGLALGLVYGIVAASNGWGSFTSDWIAPFGSSASTVLGGLLGLSEAEIATLFASGVLLQDIA